MTLLLSFGTTKTTWQHYYHLAILLLILATTTTTFQYNYKVAQILIFRLITTTFFSHEVDLLEFAFHCSRMVFLKKFQLNCILKTEFSSVNYLTKCVFKVSYNFLFSATRLVVSINFTVSLYNVSLNFSQRKNYQGRVSFLYYGLQFQLSFKYHQLLSIYLLQDLILKKVYIYFIKSIICH